jgi:hypothetical protein
MRWPARSIDQAERRARPLARRAERTARPARVRIRSRNPWVFARRRLFGWNVRLLTCRCLPCGSFRCATRGRDQPADRGHAQLPPGGGQPIKRTGSSPHAAKRSGPPTPGSKR